MMIVSLLSPRSSVVEAPPPAPPADGRSRQYKYPETIRRAQASGWDPVRAGSSPDPAR